jgi:hypothetical protein
MKTTRIKGITAVIERSPISSYYTLRYGALKEGGFMTRFSALEWLLVNMMITDVTETEQVRVIELFSKELDSRLKCETIVELSCASN